MLARLILLLLVLSALPGMSAGPGCAGGAVTAKQAMATMPGMPAHRDGAPAAEHRCIGCVPLPEALAVRVAAPAPRLRPPRPIPVRFDLRAPAPPALPPPRMG